MDLLLKNIARHISLNSREEKFFISLLGHKTLKRKEFLLREGEICHYVTFVLEGALKSFNVDNEGDEHILNFAVPGWWIADMYSFISQKPAILNIEAIANARVCMLSQENRQILFEKVPKFERFFRIIIENNMVSIQQRIIDNLSSTAEERYLHFIEKYPFIPECVPQHNIASYLGMTPEFLSKIRARLARSK
jgi:CRP-like cAMP-binding protein